MASMTPPNQATPGDRENGSMPVNRRPGTIDGPNQSDPGDRRNGTMPLGGSASPVRPPNLAPPAPGKTPHSGSADH